jgi:hypothetical protein
MIAIVLGTWQEIIKMSLKIRDYKDKGLSHFILNTNPCYSHHGDSTFFEQPDSCELRLGSGVNSSVRPNQI